MKPSIPKGTRDFLPVETARRNYIFDVIRNVYKKYGYAPIETPAMENLSTLLGKYGDEGDKLLFKILNSGDAFAGATADDLHDSAALTLKTCEKGLRYDLTVPFARFVVQHRNDIVFPFKRYQLQPVWRADRPQKGRYREFYQCDADVIGSASLLNEVELLQIIDEVFTRLDIAVVIKLNNRKILSGVADVMGEADKLAGIVVAIDKIEKTGYEAVRAELLAKGVAATAIEKLQPVLTLRGNNQEKLAALQTMLAASPTGLAGVAELQQILDYLQATPLKQTIELDLSLARGLNYYTGAIFEVKAKDAEMGSICGGGRYDDLTGVFGLSNVSGVGISFGADRIYDVLLQLDKFPATAAETTRILFFNLGDAEERQALQYVRQLRARGVVAELYPDRHKLKKQFDYAGRRGIPFAAIVGEEELAHGVISLKDLLSGIQQSIPFDEAVKKLEGDFKQ
ncbi:MAG: histidine--tRNA ligase [Prevotellaceae bacterium]|jgi:histidyl-tRNA synthetase|nr:histidine--tRNA ligase [Prevotellaceae bacterium]